MTEATSTAVSLHHRGRPRCACLHRVHRGHGQLVAGGPPHSAGAVGVHGVRAARGVATSTTLVRTGANANGSASWSTSPRTAWSSAGTFSLQWQIEEDPARTSEVEVRFIADGPSRTRVELEHRHLDRHGEGWEGLHDSVGSPKGGPLVCSAIPDGWRAPRNN